MSESDFQEELKDLLKGEDYDSVFTEMDGIHLVSTFESAGVLTRNKGLVVLMNDGSEYQITIVRSRG